MRTAQRKVEAFMRKAGQKIPDEQTVGGVGLRELRHSLIAEELNEYALAITIEEIADAITDLAYVVVGAAVAHGLDLSLLFDEVHAANMRKLRGKYTIRPDGKIIKPKDWEPPNISGVLARQRVLFEFPAR